MVNNSRIDTLHRLVTTYVVLVAATLVALVVLSLADSDQATSEAWVHAVIVAVFAVLLPVRLRAGALGPVAIIAGVLAVVNLVEAVLPGIFPVWMRVEMVVFFVLMAVTSATAARSRA
jgi:hypothetical protein